MSPAAPRPYAAAMMRLDPLLLFPTAALAHPHVFLDTQLTLHFHGPLLEEVEVAWTYDDLFSMGLFADMGLDPEADGKLTPSEVAKLQGFNLDWPKDFPGDLYIEAGVKAGGVDHPMSPPSTGW